MLQHLLENYQIDYSFYFENKMTTKEAFQIIDEFSHLWNANPVTVYYPSSGFDFSEVKYFNSENLLFLKDNPQVYLKSDGFIIDESSCRDIKFYMKHQLGPDFKILKGMRFKTIDTDANLKLCYLIKGLYYQREIWICFFTGVTNEEILIELLKNKTPIKYLFSICDGIYSGMGEINEKSICTPYYAYFYSALQTHLHITEYYKADIISRFNKEPTNSLIDHDYKYRLQQEKNLILNTYELPYLNHYYNELRLKKIKFINLIEEMPEFLLNNDGSIFKHFDQDFPFVVRLNPDFKDDYKECLDSENSSV